MAVHARLKNEFTEDEKCHNLMRWLDFSVGARGVGLTGKCIALKRGAFVIPHQ